MSKGNGNYLGQSFDGVQACPRCAGKGFLSPDGSINNAFEGHDAGPFIDCPDCQVAPNQSLEDK